MFTIISEEFEITTLKYLIIFIFISLLLYFDKDIIFSKILFSQKYIISSFLLLVLLFLLLKSNISDNDSKRESTLFSIAKISLFDILFITSIRSELICLKIIKKVKLFTLVFSSPPFLNFNYSKNYCCINNIFII